jgi:hypothetical protein
MEIDTFLINKIMIELKEIDYNNDITILFNMAIDLINKFKINNLGQFIDNKNKYIKYLKSKKYFEYNNILKEYNELKKEYNELEKEYNELEKEYNELEKDGDEYKDEENEDDEEDEDEDDEKDDCDEDKDDCDEDDELDKDKHKFIYEKNKCRKYIKCNTRLTTFLNWTFKNDITENITPISLAQAGFYYLGRKDEVCCFDCNIVLGKWNPEDIPIDEHYKLSPECEFINSIYVPIKIRKKYEKRIKNNIKK